MSIQWHAQDNISWDAIELYASRKVDGKRYILTTEFTQKELEPGYMIDAPTLRLAGDEAQQIMNELWRIGIRPKNGTGAVAHTEALEGHLADLRKIAFHALKIPTEDK